MNKTRKYLALFVASICLSLHAWAETFSVANTEGVFISYETTSETTVCVIKGESNYAGNVVIPTSVSYNDVEYVVDAIGEYAFFEYPNLESVEIPNSVQTIGGRAFENCSALASVTIGESVTRIGYDAFKRSGLTSVVLPNSLEYIDYHAFDGCANLEYVSLGLSIQTIRENVFLGCDNLATVNVGSISSLMNIEFTNNDSNPLTKAEHLYLNGEEVTELVIPDGVTEIPANFFSGLTGITSVVIPGSVTFIGDNAFSGCTSLASVTFPDSPFTLGQNVFANTAFLNNAEDGVIYVGNIVYGYQGSMPENASIVIKEGTTAIVENAFLNCTGLTSIEVPATVTYIGKNAFAGTTWYETQPDGPIYINKVFYKYKGTMALNSEYEVADGTVSISGEAFKGYTQLSKLVLPSSLTTIGEQAFHGCLGLADLSIGEGLTYTGNDAFGGCSNLNNIYVPNVAQLFFLSSGSGQSKPFALARHLFVNDEELTELVIPDGVEELNEGFFYNFGKNVTSVTIPNSVTKIGESAFKDWTNLAQVTFGESLKEIGMYAFYGCSALTRIDLPNSLESIGGHAFYDCSNLSYITLGDSLKTIGTWAFDGCNSLNTVNVSKLDVFFNEFYFGNDNANPFKKASTLHVNGKEVTELVIPYGVEELNGGFFYNFGKNVTSVILPNSVKNIGYATFRDWTNLSQVTLGDSLETIGIAAFQGCTALESIVIPNSVTTIETRVFEGCTKLSYITLGDSLKTIGEGVFLGCTALESIVIPNLVTTIGDRVFEGCTKLSYITLGDSLKTIGYRAFNGCDGFNTVNVTKLDILFNDYSFAHEGNPFSKASTLHVNGKEVTELVIPDGVEELNGGFFYNFGKNVTSVTIPNSVKNIGYDTFRDWTNLSQVTLGDSLETIGTAAFQGCTALESIVIPNSVTTIEDKVFEDCTKLSYITLGDSLKTIGKGVFQGCTALESIIIPNSVISFARDVFSNCSNLASVTLSNSLKTIGGGSFRKCTRLDSIIIPNSVTTIEDKVFEGCTKLSSITLGDSVSFIGNDAFLACDSLQRVEVTDAAAYFAINFASASSNPARIAKCLYCDGKLVTEYIMPYGATVVGHNLIAGYEDFITSIKFANSVETIGNWVFNDNQSLTKITIPNSVKNINERAFGSCHNLRTIIWGDSVATVGYHAFYDCESIEEVYINSLANWLNIEFMDFHSNPITKAKQFYFDNENIIELIIPDGCNKIPSYAFCGAKGITSAIIPNSVKSIGAESFRDCSSLSTITLGDSVSIIGNDAFIGCDSLQRVEVTNLDAWYAIQFENDKANPLALAHHLYYNGEEVTGLHIPDGIAEINEGFFKGYENVTSVVLPNSVKRIGDRAFSNLINLKSVTLGDSLKTIGTAAFQGCTALESIVIPNSVTSFARDVFNGCSNLASVTLGNSLQTIGGGSFWECTSLDSIIIPNSVTIIEDRVFEGCSKLSYISLGDSLKSIGEYAFHRNDSLQTVNVNNIETIFDVNYGNDQANPFNRASTLLHKGNIVTELVIPEGVTTLGGLRNCGKKNITSVTFPNSVKKIDDRFFAGWSELTNVVLSDSLRTIGYRAFEDCKKLTTLTLGESLSNIGINAFIGCDNLHVVNVNNLSILFNDIIYESNYMTNPFEMAKELHLCNEPITDLVVPETVKSIKGGVFKGKNIASLSLSNSVESIETEAFRDCKQLSSVVFGNSLRLIGIDAFRECTSLDSITIPNSVDTIEARAFEGCSGMSYLSIGDGVKTIGESGFYRCDGLQRLDITNLDTWCTIDFKSDGSNPLRITKRLYLNDEEVTAVTPSNKVTHISNNAFNGATGITSVTIPNSVKVIGEKAFENCEKLTLVSFGNSVDSIGHRAFANCNALKSIELPNSLKTISSGAFLDCRSVSSLTFGNSLETIGESAFRNCYLLESISLPNTITRIGASAFEGCDKVLTVTLGSRLKTIESSTFKYCRSLESITIPNSVKEISSEAFYDCYKLATVVLGDSIESIKQNAFGYIGNSNSESTKVYIPSLDWLFRVNIEEFQNEHLFQDIYIGQQPLTTITIPDNFTEAPILKMLYNSCISSLNTGDGLKILPEGKSRNITQVTLGSNVTMVEAEFPEAFIVLSNNATPPVITEKTFPKCMFDNGAEGVVVLLNANDQKAYSKAKVWEGMQMSNQSNQVAVQVSAPGSIGTDLALGLRMPVAKVVGLTVSGEINEQDIMQMNKNMMSLLYLDLSDAIVDNIPDDAFNGKQQLLSLVLPKTTKVVGNSAFKGCNGIEELQMPMDVTEIGDEAFTGTNIRSMDFNYALKKIGNRAFANTPLKEISFQNKVESIGNEAFYGCNLEQELLFSETLRSIGDRAFDGQRGISGHLTIPESVVSVGEGAFRGTSISTVFISGKMTTLESSVFANCNLLDVVYIPDNITNINSSAFQNCSSLKNLRLSQNIEEIGSEAFRAIPIRSVNVPENAKTLKSYSFADCSNLRFVTLPSTMTSLEEGVFSGCRQLMNLTTKALTPPEVKPNTFRGVNTDKCIISMPTVSIEAYITAPYWGRFMEMRNDIAVETEGNGSISFVSGDTEEDDDAASARRTRAVNATETMEDDDAASARTTRAGNATETMEDDITLVDDGSSLYVPQNGVVKFHITPAEGETILSATFDGVDITSQIVDGVFVTTADKLSSKLEVNFSQVTKTSQLITWEQSFEPLMVGDKVALSATTSSGLPVTFDFADENSKECASLVNNTLTITKSGVIAIIALQKGDDEYASVATEMKYIRAYEYGDANADMEINSADLATAVDYAIGNNPKEFLLKAADVNKDSNVNVADVSGVVDIVLSAPASTDDVNGNAREVAISNNVLPVLDGNRLNFYVTQEKESFLTFQCDVRITDDSMLELDIADNPIVSISNNTGTKNHIAVARLLTDGNIRVLVYSTDNTPIPNNYSFALHIGHELNESDIEISNAGYSCRDNGQITYASLNSGVVTGLDNVTGNIDQTDIKVNGNTISFNSTTDCLMPVVSVNGMTYMLNVKAGYNEFTINKGVYVIGKNKVIIK